VNNNVHLTDNKMDCLEIPKLKGHRKSKVIVGSKGKTNIDVERMINNCAGGFIDNRLKSWDDRGFESETRDSHMILSNVREQILSEKNKENKSVVSSVESSPSTSIDMNVQINLYGDDKLLS